MHETPRRRWRMLVAAALTAALLSACSDDKPRDQGEEPAGKDRAPSGDNGNLQDPVGARADLRKFNCHFQAGAWSASGRLVNDDKEPVTYLVRVSVADAEAGTVLGRAEKSVSVQPDGTADMTFPKFHPGNRKAACSVRVVRSA